MVFCYSTLTTIAEMFLACLFDFLLTIWTNLEIQITMEIVFLVGGILKILGKN